MFNESERYAKNVKGGLVGAAKRSVGTIDDKKKEKEKKKVTNEKILTH